MQALSQETPILYYRQAIDALVSMQKRHSGRFPISDCYDREHIKWEQSYFVKHFLVQYSRIRPDTIKKITGEMNGLTEQVLSAMKGHCRYLLHRDFQSQNIIMKNGALHIIDFQSARIGPLTYDLSSLLRDPYVNINICQEKSLFDYYYRKIKHKSLSYEKLRMMYGLTCIQRNMQALGAYANLGLNKGKRHFLKYIPRGRQLLLRGLRESNFKRLHEIVKQSAGAPERQ